ncbi:hypothetical protein [Streptomyces broussonetiae]|uniref:Uncharacterized protein n=1 Tax=Streptomyces broussonetiae TaxID=2686304 RepID=A0A6I6N6I6_9ACTN|nr:hypothetical protein [Streptomyces broussonetiae]QHA06051.1 hypothetical protein GQF42_24645 [Streptomyces broussonetiae]
MTYEGNETRLLPWTGHGGKPCYLVTDGSGQMSRIADTVERVQLGMARDLLGHAADLLADDRPTPAQLRFLLARMSEALTAVHRIAQSRGARLRTDTDDGA